MSIKGFKMSDGTVKRYDYSALENIETDNTLSRSGVAADGKAVGDEISDLKEDLADFESIGETRNLFDPIYKSETVGGVTYAYSNGTMVMSGTASGRIVMQTITGTVGDKFSLSCFDVSGGKPTFYVMNGSTVVATYRQSDMNCTFTLPTTTVTLEYYVSGAFSYSFGLTLVKDEIPSFPLLINADGQQNILNFANATYEAIGDSLTYGFTGSWTEGVQNRINTPYPEKVGELLGVKNVLNKGETGTTIANDIEKMGTYYPISNDNRLSGYSYAQIISIMGGTNDFEKGTALGTIYDSTSDTTFHAGWKRIFSNLLNRFSTYDSFIFVIVPPVTQSKYSDNSAGVKWIDYINATLEECRNFGIPVLDMSMMGRLCPTNKSLYTSDGIHFNQKYVSRIFAHMVADFIKRNCH